jgi:hypothetical protein
MSETPTAIRAQQDTERERKREECEHRWGHAGVGGVIVGLTRCEKCGTTSRESDFRPGEKP